MRTWYYGSIPDMNDLESTMSTNRARINCFRYQFSNSFCDVIPQRILLFHNDLLLWWRVKWYSFRGSMALGACYWCDRWHFQYISKNSEWGVIVNILEQVVDVNTTGASILARRAYNFLIGNADHSKPIVNRYTHSLSMTERYKAWITRLCNLVCTYNDKMYKSQMGMNHCKINRVVSTLAMYSTQIEEM